MVAQRRMLAPESAHLDSPSRTIPLTHCTPVSEPEESRQWIERYVASRSFGIMVGTGTCEAFGGEVESAASDQGRRSGSQSGV